MAYTWGGVGSWVEGSTGEKKGTSVNFNNKGKFNNKTKQSKKEYIGRMCELDTPVIV